MKVPETFKSLQNTLNLYVPDTSQKFLVLMAVFTEALDMPSENIAYFFYRNFD